mmetsp:Transcript_81852/g.237351  ORF Transcript_81852/g.237351 Transcript_81852/m.237351 type:complete len:219 (-) Transcript_81852:474-1130(-)
MRARFWRGSGAPKPNRSRTLAGGIWRTCNTLNRLTFSLSNCKCVGGSVAIPAFTTAPARSEEVVSTLVSAISVACVLLSSPSVEESLAVSVASFASTSKHRNTFRNTAAVGTASLPRRLCTSTSKASILTLSGLQPLADTTFTAVSKISLSKAVGINRQTPSTTTNGPLSSNALNSAGDAATSYCRSRIVNGFESLPLFSSTPKGCFAKSARTRCTFT